MPGRKKSRSKEDKRSDYYRDRTVELMSRFCSHDAYMNMKVSELYNYYYGNHENADYKGLLTLFENAETKGSTPFVAINYNAVTPKVERMLGQLKQRGFEPHIEATNIEAYKRKERYEAQLRFQIQMQQMYRVLAQETGIEYGVNDNLPEGDVELEQHMDEYRDTYEQLMTEAVGQEIDACNYHDIRSRSFLNYIIQGRVHGCVEIVNGDITIRDIHPANALFDPYVNTSHADDQTAFGEAYYAPIDWVIQNYDLTEEELGVIIKRYESKGTKWNKRDIYPAFKRVDGPQWGDTGFNRVLIVRMQWIGRQNEFVKSNKDQYGNIHSHFHKHYPKLTNAEKASEDVVVEKKKKQVVHFCDLIGGDLVGKYGERNNIYRDRRKPNQTKLDYVTALHNYNDHRFNSLVDRIGIINDYKNYLLTILQKEITTHIGDAVAIDVSQIPKDIYGTGKTQLVNLLNSLKAHNVVVYNSTIKKHLSAQASQAIPFKNIPGRMQSRLTEIINAVGYLDREMENITGVNQAALGNSGERTLASVNQANLQNSSLTTETYFDSFNSYEKRIMELLVNKIGQLWAADQNRYMNVAAKLGFSLPDDWEIDWQMYNVNVENLPMSMEMFVQLMELAINSKTLYPDEMLKLMLDAQVNFRAAVSKFIRMSRRARKDQMKQAIQTEQQRNQALVAAEEQKTKKELELANVKGTFALEEAKITSGAKERTETLKTKTRDRERIDKRVMHFQDGMDK